MANEPPPQGAVILYPYLWASERDTGETEGRKPRPACLILRVRDPDQAIHHLFLLAITSQPPRRTQTAIEIPDTERRRGGVMRYPRAWVIVSEFNYDVAERSWYYDPRTPALGRFSAPFVREVAKALRAGIQKSRARIDRTR
jgi:hypothetical protein